MTNELKMDSRVIAELVIHLGRIASGEGLVEGLTPAQWTVLRYFARANRFSRAPSAFAAFHGTTRGTASQTIKSMETQGYLVRVRSETDGRSARLELTDKAGAILVNDPIETLVQAAEALPPGVRGHFSDVLQRMLSRWGRGSVLSAHACPVSIWKVTATVWRVRPPMHAGSWANRWNWRNSTGSASTSDWGKPQS